MRTAAGRSFFRGQPISWSRAAVAAGLVFLVFGCATPTDMLASFTRNDRKEERFTKHYQESFFGVSEQKRFSVEVLVPAGNLQTGRNGVYFIIHDARDRDVEAADITAEYRAGSGGSSGPATITEQGSGLYTTEDLIVAGPGIGDVSVTVSVAGKADTVRIPIAAEAVTEAYK